MLVPFPEFAPDQSDFNPQASKHIVNVKPTKDGYAPLGSLVAVSDALPTAPRGGISVKNDTNTWKTFAGTATNLYSLDGAAYTWSEISRVTDDYSLGDGVHWRFARFGNYLIATAVGSDFPQYVDLGTSNDFANLTNASFEAGRVGVVGDFLVFGRVDGDNRKLKWSAVNNIFGWTKAQAGSDEQILPDGGAIQDIIPQAQNAILIQEFCIRRMVFDPASGLVFRFEIIDPERGAFAPRSIVNIGPNDFVYLAKDGFYRGVQAMPIGAQRVDKWFFENCSPDKYDLVSGTLDPFDKIVWWRFEDSDGISKRLGYHWQLDRWCHSTTDALDLFPSATAGLTLTELTTLYGTIAGMPYAVGSRFYQGGIPGLAGFTSDFKYGFFDGSNLEASIRTERKMLNYPNRATTGRIRVLADTNDATVKIAATETPADPMNFGSALSRHTGQNFINSRVSGRYHQAEVVIPAGTSWSNATGVDIEFTNGGGR
jgi:hypothetical protein